MINNPRIFRRWIFCQTGMAAVEFALMIPLLMAMFFGGVEMTRYILIQQKATKTANALADLVAQAQTLTTADMDQILDASSHLMSPYSMTADNSTIIISSVLKVSGNPPRIMWRYPPPTVQSISMPTKLGNMGDIATLPAGFVMNDKDNVIITEVYYKFQPLMLQSVIGASTIYKTAFFRPRLGALSTLN